uniref:Uncharacterized protein n=1 Tax=Anguilla anguilla TaxID=7936 RepID=A0A0E9VF87_ANGAN
MNTITYPCKYCNRYYSKHTVKCITETYKQIATSKLENLTYIFHVYYCASPCKIGCLVRFPKKIPLCTTVKNKCPEFSK